MAEGGQNASFGPLGAVPASLGLLIYAPLLALNVLHLRQTKHSEIHKAFVVCLVYFTLRIIGFTARIFIALGMLESIDGLATTVSHSGYMLLVTAFSSLFWAWLLSVNDVLGSAFVACGVRALDPNGAQKVLYRMTRVAQLAGLLSGLTGTLAGSVPLRLTGTSLFLLVIAVLQPLALAPGWVALHDARVSGAASPVMVTRLLRGAYVGAVLCVFMSLRVVCVYFQLLMPTFSDGSLAAEYLLTLAPELPVAVMLMSHQILVLFTPTTRKLSATPPYSIDGVDDGEVSLLSDTESSDAAAGEQAIFARAGGSGTRVFDSGSLLAAPARPGRGKSGAHESY